MADKQLETLLSEIRSCRHCEGVQPPLPHKARPVCIVSPKSKIRIIGQAPGNLVHQSGKPFTDPSGVRLRDWLGVNEPTFYDPDNFAITPMGFCFPGYDGKGGDLPPRKECATLWHDKLTDTMPPPKLTLLVGSYAVKHYLGNRAQKNLTETVKQWRDYGPDIIPLPHPSWRNNGWLKKHDWFAGVIEHLKKRVDSLVIRQDDNI